MQKEQVDATSIRKVVNRILTKLSRGCNIDILIERWHFK